MQSASSFNCFLSKSSESSETDGRRMDEKSVTGSTQDLKASFTVFFVQMKKTDT